ncbi:hypothetical protein PGB28_20765 [Primorskyibacter aestuariivivens]|uniref:hypothetical protein n=1 Tax=Primorskyibacter aestuariivivens TaxID=1888912 RepID=UPI002301537F|nr:hypothetical protein [Primorskyibacter aestuariivivens]MDA7430898.1 hypothetical protein [Primorskyibacter aestuariivivens]
MTQIDVFYQGEDLDDIQHLELEDAATIGDFKKLISERHGANVDVHVFIEDAEDPSSDDACLADLGDPTGLKLHYHRQRRIEVCVTYNGEDECRLFPPSATIKRVKRWFAKNKFGMAKEEAGEHLLQISGTHERPHPGTHIGALAKCGCTKLEFDLVPDQRVNGHTELGQ